MCGRRSRPVPRGLSQLTEEEMDTQHLEPTHPAAEFCSLLPSSSPLQGAGSHLTLTKALSCLLSPSSLFSGSRQSHTSQPTQASARGSAHSLSDHTVTVVLVLLSSSLLAD